MSDPGAFKSRVEQWAIRLRVRPKQIRMQVMHRKWASCSSRGRITFCLDLLGQSHSFQDYVVVHELLHLRIRNHGRLFESTLRAHLRGNRWLDRQASARPPTRHRSTLA